MLTVPIVGLTAGGPLILSMGVDRLIAVKYPTKYRYFQEEPKLYIIGQLLFPLAYSVTFLIYGFLVRDTNVKNQIICANPLALNGSAFQMFTYSSGVIYIFVFIIYLTVYILLKSNKASARFKSVFRSLAVTVGLVMFGWVTTTTANTLSYSISDNTYTAQLIQMYAGITVNAAAASNVFVFYKINSEYREVIKSLLGLKSKVNSPLFEASSTMTATKSDANFQKRRLTIV
uniref:G_PROTEIN_RECEP_F1_2 domain-containing protein n=1 Tax=Caenorhabditis japonica TaxID=281687 RepID=A0A8R1HWH3_CAEJA